MRILVCGGRAYSNQTELNATLDALHAEQRIACLIEGGAVGADALALRWALDRDIRTESYPADWKRHGRAGGPIRNQRMIDEGRPDLVIAFPGGRGTADMVKRVQAAGIEVIKSD